MMPFSNSFFSRCCVAFRKMMAMIRGFFDLWDPICDGGRGEGCVSRCLSRPPPLLRFRFMDLP